jgi:hypothetical protein
VCYLAAGLHSCRMRVDVDLVCRFPVTVVRARCWAGLVSLAWTVADGALAARDPSCISDLRLPAARSSALHGLHHGRAMTGLALTDQWVNGAVR